MPDCWLRLNLEKAHFSDDAIWKSPNCQFVTSQLFFWKNHMFLAMPSKIAKLPVFYFEIQIWKTTCFWRCHRKIAKLPDFWLRNSILEKSHLLVQVSGKLYGIEFQGVCSSASHHGMIHPIDYPKYVYEWYPDNCRPIPIQMKFMAYYHPQSQLQTIWR